MEKKTLRLNRREREKVLGRGEEIWGKVRFGGDRTGSWGKKKKLRGIGAQGGEASSKVEVREKT